MGMLQPGKGVGVRAKVYTKGTLVKVIPLRHRLTNQLDLIIKLLNVSPMPDYHISKDLV